MSSNATVRAIYFKDLESKEFSLGIPTEKGNILIGATGVSPNARLSVNVGEGVIKLSREDGLPIQIVERGRDDNPIIPKKDFVLAKPVDEIKFRPAEEDGYWTAMEEGTDLQVDDPVGFQYFTTVVADEALTKQIEARKQNVAAAV